MTAVRAMLLCAGAILFIGGNLARVAAQETPPVPAPNPSALPVAIDVDLGQKIGAWRPIYAWFGYDEGNYTNTTAGVKLLRELHDLSPAPVYVRFHHLLSSGDGTPELKWSSTGVYHEDANGKAIYNFVILDGIFDALVKAGVRPFVELGFMPQDLAASLPNRHEPYQVHFPGSTTAGASNNPPKDYAKWGELVRVVAAHLVERYGRRAVLTWYFEVWNEPDIDYWHASPEDYWKLYDYAVASERAALPGARVGGPATTGPGGAKAAAFLEGFLQHVSSGRSAVNGKPVPLDFISFHAKGQLALEDGQVRMGLDHELTDADRGFAIVAKFRQLRHLPVILSEADPEGCAACSSRQNPANNYRNGAQYPAYTAAAYKALIDLGNRRGVDLAAMLTWAFEFEGRDYFQGFRSLSTNGIDKAILNFFRMAGLMNGERVRATSSGAMTLDGLVSGHAANNRDVDVLATKSADGAAALLWNYAATERAGSPSVVSLRMRHVPLGMGRVLVSQYRIDAMNSNAYSVWKAMGSPQHPAAEQLAELQDRDGLELMGPPRWVEVEGGSVTLQTELPAESVALVTLRWER
jgi:xylan 1,4-beta-xylosidase